MKLLSTIILITLLCLQTKTMIGGTAKDSSEKSGPVLAFGLRFQKAAGFYWYNGLSLEYLNPFRRFKTVSLGLNFLSSRLGTASIRYGIPFNEITLCVNKQFRSSKPFQPQLKLNGGYAWANYGSDIFAGVSNRSAVVSLEAGLLYNLRVPLRLSLTGGINLITGKGSKGLGTLYPVYGQFSVLYRLDCQ